MRRFRVRTFGRSGVLGVGLMLSACHSGSSTSTITNVVVDNTAGTASDAMTNIDATVGSAAAMPADVNAGAGGGDNVASAKAGKAAKADASASSDSSTASDTASDSNAN